MSHSNAILSLVLTGFLGFSSASYADLASEYCKSQGGDVRPYTLTDRDKKSQEVEFCWFGEGALGTWTFYNFNHPAPGEGTTNPNPPGLAAVPENSSQPAKLKNFALAAISQYFKNRDPLTPSAEASSTNPVVPESFQPSAITSATPAPVPLPVPPATLVENPSFKFCKNAGGRPYRIKGMIEPSESTARKDNPNAAVCYFSDSAIEIWTLFWGAQNPRTQALTQSLLTGGGLPN